MDNAKVVLRVKKTIKFVDKMVSNFPKEERVLKERIQNSLYDILKYSYLAYYHSGLNDIDYIKSILTEFKMLDFYNNIAFDKLIISRKKMSELGINLKEITQMYYSWLKSCEKKKEFI